MARPLRAAPALAAAPLAAALVALACLLRASPAAAVRFSLDRTECVSQEVEAEGDIVHGTVVVVRPEHSWQGNFPSGVDISVEAPAGYHVYSAHQKTEDTFTFVAARRGLYKFCFTNTAPHHETIAFELHVGHIPDKENVAKDEHFNPLLNNVAMLQTKVFHVQADQRWLHFQTARQEQVNKALNRRVLWKAIGQAIALVSVNILQVYLLRGLFEKRLKHARV
eukprot:SM000111S18811  [mRNA]  locus=s111:446054:447495:+ [translate_table: standard]